MTSYDYNERYAAAKQYSADLARARGDGVEETVPDVPVNPDWPICNSCDRPMDHHEDERKYRCNFCMITVSEKWIKESPYVKNRDKTLAELAAMSAEEQKREYLREEEARANYNAAAAAVKARLSTQSGASHESGSGVNSTNTTRGGGTGTGSGGIFQLGDIHEIARRNNTVQSGRGYSDHSRRSIGEKPTVIHPLDVSLQRELGEKVQITSTREVNNRQPNSPGIVSKNVRGEHKTYPRYVDDGTGEPDD